MTVAKGRTYYTKTGLSGITTSSIVMALLQSTPGGSWIRAAVPATGKITFYFNQALPSAAIVGWMVLN